MPNINRILFLSLFLAIPISCSGQVVDSLTRQEFDAQVMPILLGYERKEKIRLKYLLTAKEMSLRSMEEKDPDFQALIAIQAYKFNKAYEGNQNDLEIYRALYNALKKFKKKLPKELPRDPDSSAKDLINHSYSMSKELCSLVKRSMKIEEWNKFAQDLPYEQTCN